MAPDPEDTFLSLSKNILRFFCFWLPPKSCIYLRRAFMTLVMISQYSFLIFEFIYLVNVLDDIAEASDSSYLLFTQASLCYKTTVFHLKRDSLVKLLQMMKNDAFKSQSDIHDRILSVMARRIHRLCIVFITSALTTCTLWAIVPLYNDTRSFPFKIWMPVTPERSPQYEIGYVYQVAAIYISALLFIAVDGLALSMTMFSCAQLDIILDKLSKIETVPLLGDRASILNRNYNILMACIKQHQYVILFMETVENTYHANIFFQLSGSVAIICIIALRISIEDPRSMQFISMWTYMCTMLSQVFLYCWCGHELTTRSESIREALYQCPWYQQDVRFRRILCIAMGRMRRPMVFRAGHYIPLSRQTFLSILRSSYSYYAVVNQAKNK